MTRSASVIVAKPEPRVIVVRPPKKGVTLNLKELWAYRELIYFMTWRNLKVRYKQTVLGFAWAILRPLLSMVVFSIFFGDFAKVPTDGIPYPIFSFSGLLAWELLSMAIVHASVSLVQSSNMVTKVYFPRIILPMSFVFSGVADFLIAFVVLLIMMLFYHIPITLTILTVPLFLLMTIITALGVGFWLSALNVLYRDVNYILPFINQIWLFISPITYASSLVPAKWQIIYAVNPMKGIVDGFRWALLGSAKPGPTFFISLGMALILLVSGMFYFRRMERTFADMI
jgi:lipopolysaccharide transport system permease protein